MDITDTGGDPSWGVAGDPPVVPKIYEARDANLIGEYVRQLAFPAHNGDTEIGCYTNFEVSHEARELQGWEKGQLVESAVLARRQPQHPELSKRELAQIAREEWEQDVLPNACAYSIRDGDVRIDFFWHWDGDGWMYARFTHARGGVMFAVSNDDVKKNYRWEQVDASS